MPEKYIFLRHTPYFLYIVVKKNNKKLRIFNLMYIFAERRGVKIGVYDKKRVFFKDVPQIL